MSKENDSLAQWAKLGWVMQGDKLVRASSVSPKGRVDKLPNLIERAIPIEKLTQINLGEIPNQTQEEILKVFMETGYLFAKSANGETFLLPDGSYIDVLYSFDLAPVSAPRMTQSDKWKTDPDHIDHDKRQRKPVEKYFKFKRELLSLCAENGYNLTERLNILFVVPMPDSWSKKKRLAMDNQPHKQRPDRDNYLKAFQDSFSGDDGHVWDGRTIKLWGQKGRIIIF